MRAVAHGWHKPGGGGPSVAVAKDFVAADQERKMNKGYQGRVESFANGGEVLGRTRDFIKTPDRFRDSQFTKKTEDVFGKGIGSGDTPAPKAHGKSLKPVLPKG